MDGRLDPLAQHDSWDTMLLVKNTFLEPRQDPDALSDDSGIPRPNSDPGASSTRSSILDDGDMSEGALTSKVSQNTRDECLLSSASSLNGNDEEPSVATVTLEADVLPSKGSAGHDAGTCQPCHFFLSAKGCYSALGCRFCHFQHEKEERARPSKEKRAKAKQIAKEVIESRRQDQLLELDSPRKPGASCSLRPYLQQVVTAKLKSQDKNLGGRDGTRSKVVSL